MTDETIASLAHFRDMLLRSHLNVSGISDPLEIERKHFLDALSLTAVPEIDHENATLVDVGSGNGVPAVVLALARPGLKVTALESIKKKCDFLMDVAVELKLSNLQVVCARAEDFGRDRSRSTFDVAVARAVGSLSVVAELAVPLLKIGGLFVAMKAAMSNQELTSGRRALDILGVPVVEVIEVSPFSGVRDRRLVCGRKREATPATYPRRSGMPAKRPLGAGSPGSHTS
jgi:16S rRNA (guanine527-N7)-methyltransferase